VHQSPAVARELHGPQAEHVFRYCIVALNTLARPGAVLELAPDQVDRLRNLISLNPSGRKQTKKRRPIVRIPATLLPWLDAWAGERDELYIFHHGKPVRSARRTFARRGQELGMPEFTPYTLRHKMATELRARGVTREEVAYQLGHKLPDLRTTDRYTKFDPRHLGAAKAAIEDYIRELDKLTNRDLVRPDTPKFLQTHAAKPSQEMPVAPKNLLRIRHLSMVGATGIEPVTPTMST